MAEGSALEVIMPVGDASIRWAKHGYPNHLAKWHHHPEIEIHLIREGVGHMMAGDGLVPFSAGQVALIGSGLPHNWISDLKEGETLPHRDVLCQIRPEKLRTLVRGFPEAMGIEMVLRRADHALVLSGDCAKQAGTILEKMEQHTPLRRVADLIDIFSIFIDADEKECRTVVTPGYSPASIVDAESRVNHAIAYVSDNLGGEITLEGAASCVAMNPSAFSRFFHKATGVSFSDFVRKLRIARACHLLISTNSPVAFVQRKSGYSNSANFNRRFVQETGMTPSQYRKMYR